MFSYFRLRYLIFSPVLFLFFSCYSAADHFLIFPISLSCSLVFSKMLALDLIISQFLLFSLSFLFSLIFVGSHVVGFPSVLLFSTTWYVFPYSISANLLDLISYVPIMFFKFLSIDFVFYTVDYFLLVVLMFLCSLILVCPISFFPSINIFHRVMQFSLILLHFILRYTVLRLCYRISIVFLFS